MSDALMDPNYFPHKCERDDCDTIVTDDSRPNCFQHTVEIIEGYSARAKSQEDEGIIHEVKAEKRNVFQPPTN